MKQFLHAFLLLTLVSFSSIVSAQTGSCTVTDILVQNIRPVENSPCTFTFDVAFTMSSNSSKYVYFQSYIRTQTQDNYPDFFDCENGTTSQNGTVDPPTFAELGQRPFLNILIDNSGATPVLSATYPADNAGLPITGLGPNSTVTRFDLGGLTRFNLLNLQVTVPASLCVNGTVSPFLIITDFFGTNANNPNVIQCVSCEVPFAAAFYTASPVANCGTGALTVTLTSNNAEAFSGTAQLFVDVNENRLYTPGVDVPITLAPLPFNLTGVGTTSSFSVTVPPQYLDFNVILITQITTGFGAGASIGSLLVTCGAGAALPVNFKSFTANRRNQNVELKWETASESNNKGFYVQRNIGKGWTDLGWVSSKAQNGNSSGDLSYAYTDANNSNKGVSQYRILQVDIDGKSKVSEIRVVRGLDNASRTLVYPNPSLDGKVNVVFEEAATTWNVFVSDMNGRVIKQLKGITNNARIENLTPGMYMIRMVDVQTGKQINEKLVVNSR